MRLVERVGLGPEFCPNRRYSAVVPTNNKYCGEQWVWAREPDRKLDCPSCFCFARGLTGQALPAPTAMRVFWTKIAEQAAVRILPFDGGVFMNLDLCTEMPIVPEVVMQVSEMPF